MDATGAKDAPGQAQSDMYLAQRAQDAGSRLAQRKTKTSDTAAKAAAPEPGSTTIQGVSSKEHGDATGAAYFTSGFRLKHCIDIHKVLTPLVILTFMWASNAWELPAIWAYLAMHGTYGVLWVVKSNIFPDKRWEARATVKELVMMLVFLGVYWVAPWLIVCNQVQVAPWYLGLCFTLYTVGNFLMFTSDMQKHTHLKLRPGTLLSDGLFGHCRNANYLGECLMYIGFLSLAKHPLPLGWMLFAVLTVWVPGMRSKDASLARYPAFEEWKARSALFIPGVF